MDSKGEEHILYFAFESWWVGDLHSFYTGSPSQFNVQALEDCELLIADKTNYTTLLQHVKPYEEYYRKKIGASYTAAQERITANYSDSVVERYLKLLQKSPQISERVLQRYIASFLGIQPKSLSRIRKKLSKK